MSAKQPAAASNDAEADELIKLDEVKRLAGIGKTMIYRLERDGRFPRRYKPGGYASRWSRNEVIAWRDEQREAA